MLQKDILSGYYIKPKSMSKFKRVKIFCWPSLLTLTKNIRCSINQPAYKRGAAMTQTEEIFDAGGTVAWKDYEEFETESDMDNVRLLKIIYGPGPFVVAEIFALPPYEAKLARHSQRLALSGISREALMVGLGNKKGLGGFWFKKISSPKPV